MSKFCLISQKRVVFGHNVSHANNKTKRTFTPNVRRKAVKSDLLGRVRLMLSSRGMRTIEKYGGIDQYLLEAKLSNPSLKKLRKRVIKCAQEK